MKNLKNMLTGISLAAVLMVGAASANAGILVGDHTSSLTSTNTCTATTFTTQIITAIVATLEGILVGDRAALPTCQGSSTSRDGILVGD